MKELIALGVLLGFAVLSEPAPAQTLKSPQAIAAQKQSQAKPAADELVTLLQSKGILTETEAALAADAPSHPETRQVLAEMLLSKQLISKKEYDWTLRACAGTTAQARPKTGGNGEPGGYRSLSDWIGSILPGGGQTTDLDFGTIQPSPMWPPGEEPQHARAKAKQQKPRKHHGKDASTNPPATNQSAPKQ